MGNVMSRRRRQQTPRRRKPLKLYLIVTLVLVVAVAVIWAIGPYLGVFSSSIDLTQRGQDELAVESREHLGQRFLTGMIVGAALALIWIVGDLVAARRSRTKWT